MDTEYRQFMMSYVRICSWRCRWTRNLWGIVRQKCMELVLGRHTLDLYVFQWLQVVMMHQLSSPRPNNLQRNNDTSTRCTFYMTSLRSSNKLLCGCSIIIIITVYSLDMTQIVFSVFLTFFLSVSNIEQNRELFTRHTVLPERSSAILLDNNLHFSFVLSNAPTQCIMSFYGRPM